MFQIFSTAPRAMISIVNRPNNFQHFALNTTCTVISVWGWAQLKNAVKISSLF